MSAPPSPSRRSVLVALTSLAPMAMFVSSGPAGAADADGAFMQASRAITGTPTLSATIGARIEALLGERDAGFAARLGGLHAALQPLNGARDAMLAALTPDQVETALDIARPWYLGYIGKPSSTILKDDAIFATFIEAQGFDKILDEVPRPTFPGENAGWWSAPPYAVTAPPMPPEILSWTFHPGGPEQIQPPDAAWRAYAAAPHASIDEARRAKPA